MAIASFQVGGQLWYVPKAKYKYLGEPRYVTITKIGRKWLYVGEDWLQHKVDAERLSVHSLDGQHGFGYCYRDKSAYEHSQLKAAEWQKLKNFVDHQYQVPEKITLTDIIDMQEMVGMRVAERVERAPVGERVYPMAKPEPEDQDV